jgi:rod shape-determining protein MreD
VTVNSRAIDRLRLEGSARRTDAVRPQDAEVFVPPRFWALLLAAVSAIVVQSTILQPFSLRGAHVSLLTILLVWTGLRCGVTTTGALGLVSGAIEDALGGSGVNVLATTVTGLCAGLLNVRFFADSLPVFVSAVGLATLLRGAITYAVSELGFGIRGSFHRASHELLWQFVLNCVVAALALFVERVAGHVRK